MTDLNTKTKRTHHPQLVMFRRWRKQLKAAGFNQTEVARLMIRKARMLREVAS